MTTEIWLARSYVYVFCPRSPWVLLGPVPVFVETPKEAKLNPSTDRRFT